MKRVFFICCNLFIVSVLFAQNTKTENIEINNIEYFTSLNKNIQCGKIHIQVNDLNNKKSLSNEYQIFFCKKNADKFGQREFLYNILSLKDSMQYVYNQNTWYVVNHRKKTYELETDSSWCKISCLFPYLWPEILIDLMNSYYLQEKTDINEQELVSIEENDTSFSLKQEISNYSENHIYMTTKIYVWDKNTLLLSKSKRQISKFKDKGKYQVISNKETSLIGASLNKDEYLDSRLYDGKNYININYKESKKKL